MKKVLAFGTFDILHPGHIYFLQKAKSLGDYLIVSLATDRNVKKIKGRLPHHSKVDRKALISALRFVDKVVVGAQQDYLGHIAKLKPQIIALGYDQQAFTKGLKEKLAAIGLKVKLVRIKPYRPGLYKTSKLMKSLGTYNSRP